MYWVLLSLVVSGNGWEICQLFVPHGSWGEAAAWHITFSFRHEDSGRTIGRLSLSQDVSEAPVNPHSPSRKHYQLPEPAWCLPAHA